METLRWRGVRLPPSWPPPAVLWVVFHIKLVGFIDIYIYIKEQLINNLTSMVQNEAVAIHTYVHTYIHTYIHSFIYI